MIEVSVIVPTFNRAEQVMACLEALSKQTCPLTDYEVVVVVDGSTDGTLEKLATFQPPYALRVVSQPNGGQCAALNHGVAEARGRICIFLDDDIRAAPGLIAEHLRLHRECDNVVGVGQITLTLPPTSDWYARAYAEDWREHYSLLNARTRRPTWLDCYGGNMSVARATFLEVGGWAAGLARAYDVELARRLERSGCSFEYLPEALGDQAEHKGFRALAVDSERSGASSVELSRRHPAVLPTLLGWFRDQGPRMSVPLRLLLAMDPPPRRLDRFGSLLKKIVGARGAYDLLRHYSYWRGVRHAMPDRSGWESLTGAVPILMYHAFGAPGEPPGRYVVPVQRFGRQMAWLKARGYRVLSLDELLRFRRERRALPARSIVITIDDGYADNWSIAYPILRRHGFPATIFLVSDRRGSVNWWDRGTELAGRPLLSLREAREMLDGGIGFGAHTRTHPDLTTLMPVQAREEIAGSRADLKRELGVPIRLFSYPYGRHNSATIGLADAAGFLGSCGINSGANTLATPSHDLRRVEIQGTDSLISFVLAVRYGARLEVLRKWITQR